MPRVRDADAHSTLPPDRWGHRAGGAVVVLAGLALAWIAFAGHPVGDYYTESDFYGWYAAGARLIASGHPDPTRYPVVGPGFDAAVALVSGATRDPFTAAKLVSWAAAVGTLVLWRSLLARRLGPWAAAWSVAFLAAIPVFARYAYSATTDMLCTFLVTACAFVLLQAPARWVPAAGALAALATLTRYNAVVLVPAGMACIALSRDSRRGLAGVRFVAGFLAGFLVVVAPWWAYSATSGHRPGESLFQNFGFYSTADASRNVQDAPRATDEVPRANESFTDVLRRDPVGFGLRIARAAPEHLARDARELLGPPAAACAVAGLVALVVGRSVAPLAPIGVLGAALFAGLLLAFYSDRYSLPLAPAYLALLGGLATPRFSRGVGRIGLAAVWTVLAAAWVATIGWSAGVQRQVLEQTPAEVIPAGHAIAAAARPGDRVISRKGHVGYYAGVETASFPRVATLEQLAAWARQARAGFLYYSWYECFIRPEFAYLLDSTATIPGLTRIYATDANPAVVFRIGPGFGEPPPWLADSSELAAHRSRALVRVLPAPQAWSHHIVLAAYAAEHDRWWEVLREARIATGAEPDSALGWTVLGDALRRLGRFDRAREAYTRAIALDPRDADARLGLGWVELLSGNSARAGELWRPLASRTHDSRALAAMVTLFRRLGDEQSLIRIRQAKLARIGDIGTN